MDSKKLFARSSSTKLESPGKKQTFMTNSFIKTTSNTNKALSVKARDLVLLQDEPDQPRHVGEGPGLDVRDDVVGHVDREKLRLSAKDQRSQSV